MNAINQLQEFQVGGMAESTMKDWYQSVIKGLLASNQEEVAEKLAKQFMDDYQAGHEIRNPE